MSTEEFLQVQKQANILKERLNFTDFSVSVFTRLFSKAPDLVHKFLMIESQGDPYDESNPALVTHSERIMAALFDYFCIGKGEDNQLVKQMMTFHAETHARRHVTADHYTAFFGIILEILLENEPKLKITIDRTAWKNVYDYIAQGILQRYRTTVMKPSTCTIGTSSVSK